MIELITPSRLHRYVVGIDFGHAETSAAICDIDWEHKAEEQKLKPRDIVLWKSLNKEIITSAISKDYAGRIHIHDDAFKYIGEDKNNFRIGFKEMPTNIDGPQERLMIEFMRDVYLRVRENEPNLTDENHIVYIARPSGWQDEETKDIYKRMALMAGIPLAGLTAESRAAIFYEKKENQRFSASIIKGAVVFDLGSSTLDVTYISGTNVVDQGINLGASIIDNAIFQHMILEPRKELSTFIGKYPEYRDALLFKSRQFKEKVYGSDGASPVPESFYVEDVLLNRPSEIIEEASKFPPIRLKVENTGQLDRFVDEYENYSGRITDFLSEFKRVYIKKKPIIGVLLVGGASNMHYIPELIANSFGIDANNVRKEKDPNLTVSRGIALLGSVDTVASVYREEYNNSIPDAIDEEITFEELKSKLTDTIFSAIWDSISKSANNWAKKSKGVDKEKLNKQILDGLENDLSTLVLGANSNLEKRCRTCLEKIIQEKCEDLIDGINDVVAHYSNDVSVSSKDVPFGTLLPITFANGLISENKQYFVAISKKISNNIIMDFIRSIFHNDEKSRRLMIERLPKFKEETKTLLQNGILDEDVLERITGEMKEAIKKLMSSKIKEVQIPIE